MQASEEFIDQIYEAAAVPELWQGVLDRLASLAGSVGTTLLTADAHNLKWITTDSLKSAMHDFIAEGWHLRNSRMPLLLARKHAGFLREIDVYDTAAEVDQDSHIRDFFRPRGLGWAAATAIPIPTGDMLVFSIERAHARGPVETEAIAQLDALRPHLARAALLSARLRLESAKASTAVLGRIGIAGGILGQGGRLIGANEQFEKLIPQIFLDRRERLTLANPSADKIFGEAFEQIKKSLDRVLSIPLAARKELPPMIVHIIPTRRAAHDIFASAISLVVVTPVEIGKVPTAEVLQGLFDLTPAEARVARSIGEGRTIDQIASGNNLSRETVRSQLKTVFAKTGLSRQSELAALVARTTF